MSYDFSDFKKEISEIEQWLSREYAGIRTGMASPALLDNVKVESYGTLMPVNQIANIGVEDARTLRVSPWDKSQIKGIEKALTNADLGVSVVTDSEGLRIIFPELTSERREVLIRTAKEKQEKARVSLRMERDKVWDEIQEKEKEGEITEDDKYRYKEEMQKHVDEANKKFEEMFEKKELEISN